MKKPKPNAWDRLRFAAPAGYLPKSLSEHERARVAAEAKRARKAAKLTKEGR